MKTVDASALINFLAFPEEFESHRQSFDDELVAPAVLVPEFLNGVKKLHFRREISQERASLMVSEFGELEIELLTLADNRIELWDMSENMTPYDASYVIVARKSQSPLVTSDGRLARSASRSTDVILLE